MSVRGPLGATSQSAGLELTRAPRLDTHAAPSTSSRRALLAVAGLLITGIVIAISAANTEPLLPLSIRPVPATLAGAFGGAGLNLHSGGAIAVLTLMTICYVSVALLAGELSTRTVLMAIAALNAVVLLAPPLVSTDIFSYQAYARMGSLFGINPYLSGPHALGIGDPVFPYIGAKWWNIPSVYGPAFTVFSYLLAPLAVGASVLVYKSIAAVSSLGIVALVFNAARLRGVNPVRAAALVGLNPLLVLYGVGGGHNDLLMLLAMVAAVYAILRSRERLGGGLAVLAIGIKLTAGIMLPFAIAAGGPLRKRGRRDLLIGAGAVARRARDGHAGAVRPRRVEHVLDDPAQPERGRLAQPPGCPIDPAWRGHRGTCRRLRARGRVRGRVRLAGASRLARPDGLDRRGGLGDGRDAGSRQLAAAVVCGVAASVRRAVERPAAVSHRARADLRRAGRRAARLHPTRSVPARFVSIEESSK